MERSIAAFENNKAAGGVDTAFSSDDEYDDENRSHSLMVYLLLRSVKMSQKTVEVVSAVVYRA